jgi:hypothetical protein
MCEAFWMVAVNIRRSQPMRCTTRPLFTENPRAVRFSEVVGVEAPRRASCLLRVQKKG